MTGAPLGSPRQLWPLVSVIALAGCASAPPPRLERVTYKVVAEPTRLEVEVEVHGGRPERWYLLGERELRVAGERGEATTRDGVLALRARTLRYAYPLALGRGQSLERGAGTPRSYLLRGDRYLLVPPQGLVAPDAEVELRVSGLEPFLPWPTRREGQEWVATLRPADLRQLGVHAFGARRVVAIGPEQLAWRLAVLEGELLAGDAIVDLWIEQAAREAISMSAGDPQAGLAITLVPSAGAEPAGFGRVLYSSPRSAALYVGQRAPARAFEGDWLATHELMHTLHPRFGAGLRFLSEGIATYYQCLAPIRSGRGTPAELWAALARGVEAGRVDARGRSLREVTRDMHRLRAYGAVYWGGALLALELDVELRRATAGARGLEHVLLSLRGLDAVSLRGFGRAVDAIAGAEIWEPIRRAHLHGLALARGEALLTALGIGVEGLDPKAPAARWRELIERGS